MLAGTIFTGRWSFIVLFGQETVLCGLKSRRDGGLGYGCK